MKTSQILTFIVYAFVSSVHAQQSAAKPALPDGPLLNRAPEFFQWTVTFRAFLQKGPAGEKPQANQNDSRTTVEKTKTIYHVQSVDGTGSRTEKWMLGDLQITILPHAEAPIVAPANKSNTFFTDYSKGDFSGFDWISLNNFVETKNIQGVDCLIFKDKIKALPTADSASGENAVFETVDAEAVINATSRLPVALHVGDTLAIYEYGPPPSSILIPPTNLLSLVDNFRERNRKASIIPPP